MILSQNVPLKKYSNLKIGGPASYFFEFRTKDSLLEALNEWRQLNLDLPILTIGSGTNILFSDDGFEGLILKDSLSFIDRDGENITVGSGTIVSDLVSFCTQNSLSGFEWAGGLPGTLGGGIRGNAGAFGGEMKDNVSEVESVGIKNLKIIKRKNKECNFGYRTSVYKSGEGKEELILSAVFNFKKGDATQIKESTQEKIDYRIDRHPLDLPNLGSTFKNIDVKNISGKVLEEFKDHIKKDPFPVLPVAKLLIGANLKGRSIGGARFSEKHPNFIVNFNNAKAKDILALIDLAKKEIKSKYDISLEEEILII